jgi:hypothetical protein
MGFCLALPNSYLSLQQLSQGSLSCNARRLGVLGELTFTTKHNQTRRQTNFIIWWHLRLALFFPIFPQLKPGIFFKSFYCFKTPPLLKPIRLIIAESSAETIVFLDFLPVLWRKRPYL